MIKRRFYRFEHEDKDAPSESSSSSDSEFDAEATDETEVSEEDNVVADARKKEDASSSSGYESEDSSVNEVNLDSSGLPTSDDDFSAQKGAENIYRTFASIKDTTILDKKQRTLEKNEISVEKTECILKSKSVFKCRLCPRIVCLSEETLKAHLNSKRHARSEKLLKEGRLKFMLNEKGEIEGETYYDKPAVTIPSEEKLPSKSKKKGKGRGKPNKRLRQETKSDKSGRPMKNRENRRKNDS